MTDIRKQPGKYWGYAHLRPRSEKLVARRLEAEGIAFYLPLLPKARLHHGSKVVAEIPMIPGYIFLAADDLERSDLKRSEKHIVQIELVRDEYGEEKFISELNALRRFELLGRSEKILINPGIQRGDTVRITDGPLKGLETIVVRREDDTDSIVVNLTILNKSVEYPVSAAALKKIAD